MEAVPQRREGRGARHFAVVSAPGKPRHTGSMEGKIVEVPVNHPRGNLGLGLREENSPR